MSDERVPSPSNPADDWKMWLVVNPATWLMPILFAVLATALVVHIYVANAGVYFNIA
ncbi:light-harvesting antenna LH1, alpha subunit [Thiorhodospira sibirica]|uniref:light-harvesting antenna LH1, alpha subunit n=1 Tax=Thiorhodospira sibirica TaxID=154347 RepID=UPI00022C04B1|nr:light-harvesting antenna LH1, alpha subunit [Thiorhodospira sibirica]